MAKKLGKIAFVFSFLILFSPFFVFADSLGETKNFFIDPSYDFQNREQITASLKKISQKGYFYIEDNWLQNLTETEKEKINQSLEDLASEFDNVIYPKLTSIYGEEWRPGIDLNYTITILFHKMKEKVAGYFKEDDEYYKLQSPGSNEREMLYLNANYLDKEIIKSFIAHEFTHLITFNQKNRLRQVEEEVWLNEARAEIAISLLGYDDLYQESNLQQRVKQFINSPSDSLTEWQNQRADYGVVNVFSQYLIDHYGIEILTNSLKSSKVGIASINEALKNRGFSQDFSQIFRDWSIAVYLQNCAFGERYCYKNENLKNLKVSPSLIYLPLTQKAEFSLDYSISQWAGNWYRIIGGEGKLKVNFSGDQRVNFKIPYILCKNSQQCQINSFILDKEQKGEIIFDDFGKKWTSLTLIPLIQDKISGFEGKEPNFSFSLSASITQKTSEDKLREELLVQIAFLKSEIAKLQAQLKNKKMGSTIFSCQRLENNLYYGMINNPEVRCLQEFLKSQ